MYLLPLGLLILFSMVVRILALGDGFEIISGLVGLLSGFLWVKQRLKNKKDGFQARILEE
jgi:sigma-E factor negative regulatory protein RseC